MRPWTAAYELQGRNFQASPVGLDRRSANRRSAALSEKPRIPADRGGIDGERALGDEAQEIVRAAGFRASAGESFAAEWLHADDGAGHAAIDVAIADVSERLHLAPGR